MVACITCLRASSVGSNLIELKEEMSHFVQCKWSLSYGNFLLLFISKRSSQAVLSLEANNKIAVS